MQKAKEKGLKCHYHFIDFKSAFDAIWRKALLWKMMRSIGINKKIVSVVEKMHDKTSCDVVADGLLTEWFSVSVGIRQGCLLSPTLFVSNFLPLLFLDFVMDEIKCLQDLLTLDEDLNFNTRYANDTALIATDFERLQLATDQLQEGCKTYGMKINNKKCKVISDTGLDITAGHRTMSLQKQIFTGQKQSLLVILSDAFFC